MFASMMKKCFPALLSLALWGCAPSRDFQTIPQEGAQRSDMFPRFSDKPEAETSQFTQTDAQMLTQELEQEAQRLKKQTGSSRQKAYNSKSESQNLREEVEKTLRQIERGKP